MATNTYVALKTSTVTGSSAPSITLDNIPQGYTDLRIVISAAPASSGMNYLFQVGNGSVDTTSTYSQTFVSGTGSVANSNRTTSATYWQAYINAATTNQSVVTAEIQNYSSGAVYKPVIIRANGSGETTASAGIWRSTSAINIVTVTAQTNNFAIGSSITIYGIAAEGALAKATGGAIYSDSQYWYHAFGASGTFTPTQSLTADILVVAGGGSGGNRYGNAGGGGGGGAGGVLAYSSQSLSTSGYTVTVGGGGAAVGGGSEINGSQGTNSSFGVLTAAVGGGYGQATANAPYYSGGSGGSGGGGRSRGNTGGAATSGQGYAGGDGGASSDGGAGGGGAGGIGGSTTSGTSGAVGGIGTNTYATWLATVGAGVDGYIAAGGGGGAYTGGSGGAGGTGGGGAGSLNSTATSGRVNTGSGGGSAGANTTGSWYSGAGGSGIVIVRYAK